MNIFTDGFTKMTISNNNLRVTLVQNGPDGEKKEVGNLIIPANMAAGLISQLAIGVKQLEEQLKKQKDAQAEAVAEARREAEANQGQEDFQ